GRYGDVFGPGVNLASRISQLANPSCLLVDAPTAELLADDDRYILTPFGETEVRGVGVVDLVQVDSVVRPSQRITQ
ncbi:MAG: adenylate/guanylate cyclase domain-containing protein, partial [Cellulomonadaceae bacterium]|nr:adenylate/guanylate cyclase domain-containing protein [Cellulomonadaceae bacterium]